MNACGINRNINNIIVKKGLLIPTIEKKMKCDSETYVIMVYSTWGNYVPDTKECVILRKFSHDDYNHVQI